MRSRTLLPAASLLALAACSSGPEGESDPKLDQLTVGIARDSVLRILGPVTAEDSLPNVYRKEAYLLDGMWTEVLFYSAAGLKEGKEPAAAESTLRPITLVRGFVTGWGWTQYDSIARRHDIRVRIR
jgi:hypothetical protein